MKTLFKISSYGIIGLGTIHTTLTPVFYKTLDLNTIWFMGSGLALIYCAMFNLSAIKDYGGLTKITCIIGNFILLCFAILPAMVMPPEPQLIAFFISIFCLLISSILYRPKPIID
jgi:hypothetical protein